MQGSVEMESNGWSGSPACRILESGRPGVKLRQIIVPVDLTHGYSTSIDYAICFAKLFGSTVNLLHLYQEQDVVNQSFRSGGCDLFKEERQKVFADFYQLLRDTRNRYANSIGYFEYGDFDREIDVIASKLRADLIIVSVHHGKWLEHLLFGKRVDGISASAPCPVLLVGERKTDLLGRTTLGL